MFFKITFDFDKYKSEKHIMQKQTKQHIFLVLQKKSCHAKIS
jgi:hypothetical protein